MRVLSVRFKSSVPLEQLHDAWMEVAPQIAALPGFVSKVWIRNGDLLGGLYTFKDQASVDAYAAGPIVAAMMSSPVFSDFRIEQYEALEEFSAITHGIPAGVTP